jgi:hypothetical protein
VPAEPGGDFFGGLLTDDLGQEFGPSAEIVEGVEAGAMQFDGGDRSDAVDGGEVIG